MAYFKHVFYRFFLNARFKALQENAHVVVRHFDLHVCTHEKILKPVFDVSVFYFYILLYSH